MAVAVTMMMMMMAQARAQQQQQQQPPPLGGFEVDLCDEEWIATPATAPAPPEKTTAGKDEVFCRGCRMTSARPVHGGDGPSAEDAELSKLFSSVLFVFVFFFLGKKKMGRRDEKRAPFQL